MRRGLLRAGAWNAGATTARVFGGVAAAFGLPLLISVRQYGRYAYYAWLIGLLSQLCLLGTVQGNQRFMAVDASREERQIQGSALDIFTVALSTVVLGLFVSFGSRAFAVAGHGVSLLIVSAVVVTIVGTVWSSRSKGHFDFRTPCYADIAGHSLRILGYGAVVLLDPLGGWRSLLSVEVAYRSVRSAVLYRFLSRQPDWKFTRIPTSAKAWGRLVRSPNHGVMSYVTQVGVITVLDYIVWQRIEVWFLNRYRGPIAVSQFTLASQAGMIAVVIGGALLEVLLPAFAAGSEAALTQVERRVIDRAFAGAWIGVAALIIVMACIAGPLVTWFYPKAYGVSAALLPLLALGQGSILIGGVMSTIMYSRGLVRPLLILNLCGGLILVVLEFLLVPRSGIWAAAFVATGTQLAVTSVTMLYFEKYYEYSFAVSAKSMVLSLGATGLAWYLGTLSPGVGLAVGLGALVLIVRREDVYRSMCKEVLSGTWRRR